MSISERDIYETAHMLVARHGTAAEYCASDRVIEFSNNGDEHGAYIWRRVLAAVEFLITEERLRGMRLQ